MRAQLIRRALSLTLGFGSGKFNVNLRVRMNARHRMRILSRSLRSFSAVTTPDLASLPSWLKAV